MHVSSYCACVPVTFLAQGAQTLQSLELHGSEVRLLSVREKNKVCVLLPSIHTLAMALGPHPPSLAPGEVLSPPRVTAEYEIGAKPDLHAIMLCFYYMILYDMIL